jgi:hypothetical protein
MSEETRSADKYAPWGVVLAIGCSAGVGFLYIIAMMFSIQDPSDLFTGNPATAPLGSANGYIAGRHPWGPQLTSKALCKNTCIVHEDRPSSGYECRNASNAHEDQCRLRSLMLDAVSGCAGQIFYDAFYARFGTGTGGAA